MINHAYTWKNEYVSLVDSMQDIPNSFYNMIHKKLSVMNDNKNQNNGQEAQNLTIEGMGA